MNTVSAPVQDRVFFPGESADYGGQVSDYLHLLNRKLVSAEAVGFDLDAAGLHPLLFDWQRLVVQWALRLGRAALFEERGLGKTVQQVEWGWRVHQFTGKRGLIVCPLAVAHQTIKEAAKVNVEVTYCRSVADVRRANSPIVITNYDMLKHFEPDLFGFLILDESSILKNYSGKIKTFILSFVRGIPYRLFCTATPAPNDHLELGNHAEGLGVMPSNEMIARWFITSTDKDTGTSAGKYKLKTKGTKDFWRWMTSWAVCISKPSDIGFSDAGYERPPLDIRYHQIGVDHTRAWDKIDTYGQRSLMLDTRMSATAMWAEKRQTYRDRCELMAALALQEPAEYQAIWCDTNDESTLMAGLLPDAVEVKGSDPIEKKEEALNAFSDGQVKAIVTKAKIAGMGLNWQHCARHKFVSANYKWEEWYQAVGRSDRFGNKRQVRVDMVHTETEQNIIKALERKGKGHARMQQEVNEAARLYGLFLQQRRELSFELGNVPMRLPAFLGGNS